MDNLTPTDPMLGSSEPGDSKQPFYATRNGRTILAAVALVVVLAGVGAAVYFFLLAGQDDTGSTATTSTPSAVTTTTASAEASPTEPARKSVKALFTFRNVFMPTSGPGGSDVSADGSSVSTSTGDFSDVPADTLYFISMSVVDSKSKGDFFWNGTVYTAGEGEPLGSTPWKVLSFSGSTATMLYGDTQTTISVGQGIGK